MAIYSSVHGGALVDLGKGSPTKLKDIPISKLVKRLAKVINKMVDGKGDITAKIKKIAFTSDLGGKVGMHLELKKRISISDLLDKEKDE